MTSDASASVDAPASGGGAGNGPGEVVHRSTFQSPPDQASSSVEVRHTCRVVDPPFAPSTSTDHTRTTQQLEQHCFGLIVAMMRQSQPISVTVGKRGMPHPPRRAFQSFAAVALNLDMNNAQRHLRGRTQLRTKPDPGVGIEAKTVMNMHGGKHYRHSASRHQAAQSMQQHYRITATGKRDT